MIKKQGIIALIAVPLSLFIIGILVLSASFLTTMKKEEVLSVEVVDQTTGGEYGDGSLLDDERIINELSGKKAHSDLNILVYAKDGEYEDNLNEDTLNYVREHRPELISGDKWADDTVAC